MQDLSAPAISLELSIGGMAVCPPGSGVPPRVLDDFEFVWVVEGDATWFRGGRGQPAPADTVILVQPGVEDAFRWDPDRPSRVVYLHFRIRAGHETLPPRETWPSSTRLGRDDLLQPLFRQIVRLSEEQPEGWEELAHSAACHLLRSFVTRTHDATVRDHTTFPPAVERALVHVHERWAAAEAYERVALDELCDAAAVSPRHLSRLFHETFGAGPAEMLRLARLEIAVNLLHQTDMTIASIADVTGFANPFHLSRAFKAVHGSPPGTFRTSSARSPATGPSVQARRLLGRLLPRSLS